MEILTTSSHVKTVQVMHARVLADSRHAYGAVVDDTTLQLWVSNVLASLLTEHTRVTTFVPVLAMREIQRLVEQFYAPVD
jgi:uncharacterized protein YpbB